MGRTTGRESRRREIRVCEDFTITGDLPSGYLVTHVRRDRRLGRMIASSGDGFGLSEAHYRLQCESCVVCESVACMTWSLTSRGQRKRGVWRLCVVGRIVSWEPENESHQIESLDRSESCMIKYSPVPLARREVRRRTERVRYVYLMPNNDHLRPSVLSAWSTFARYMVRKGGA